MKSTFVGDCLDPPEMPTTETKRAGIELMVTSCATNFDLHGFL
ncbi:hypothetical protein [Rhizobium sp. RAF56]